MVSTTVTTWVAATLLPQSSLADQIRVMRVGQTPFVVALLPSPGGGHLLGELPGSGPAWPHHLACLAWGTLFSVPAVLAFAGVDRLGGQDRTRNLLGALAAAVWSNAALQLQCPVTESSHLVLGHAGVVVSLVALWSVWQWRLSRTSALARSQA